MIQDVDKKVEAAFGALVGSRCTKCVVVTGSQLALAFEVSASDSMSKKPSNVVLIQRENAAVQPLLGISCAWRLARGTDVLCSWFDAVREEGWEQPISNLIDATVVRVDFCWPDCRVYFDNDHCLAVFADQNLESERILNYSLSLGGSQFRVGLKGKGQISQRKKTSP